MTKELDLSKPVQTRDGRAVRILCTDRKGSSLPVTGLITLCDGRETIETWTLKGCLFDHREEGSVYDGDLVNVPEPPRTRVMWMPVFEAHFHNHAPGGTMFETKEAARRECELLGLADGPLCIMPVEITDRWEDDGEE